MGVERGRTARRGQSVRDQDLSRRTTHDGEEKKNGVDEAANVDSSAVKTCRAAETICVHGSSSQSRLNETRIAQVAHLALAKRLLHPLFAFAPLLLFPLADPLNPRLEQRLLAPPLVLGLLLCLAAESPPFRMEGIDLSPGRGAERVGAVKGRRPGKRRDKERADEEPVLRELPAEPNRGDSVGSIA